MAAVRADLLDRLTERREPLKRAAERLVFPFFLLLALAIVILSTRGSVLGFDFRGTLWDPGKAILSGRTPYPPPHASAIRTGNPAVYPPPVMLVGAPLTLLPWAAGVAIWMVTLTVGALAGLYAVGVRDWRIFILALISFPFLIGLIYGNLLVLLMLGLGIAWRWRDRPFVAGTAVAALVVAKLFLWPLGLWLLITRRIRAAVYAVAITLASLALSWAVIAFRGLHSYPQLLDALDRVYTRHSLSVTTLAMSLGLRQRAAEAVALALGLVVVGVAAAMVRRPGGDERLYGAAVLGSLIATPIFWIYYFFLLLVPLALFRPRLSVWWWLVLGFWVEEVVGSVTSTKAPCCAPAGMPSPVWSTLSTRPSVASLVFTPVLILFTAVLVFIGRRSSRLAPARQALLEPQ